MNAMNPKMVWNREIAPPGFGGERLSHLGLGQSAEASVIRHAWFDATEQMYKGAITHAQQSPAFRFYSLLGRWKEETKVISDTNATAMHPAYQQIIGMGPAALPYIYVELQKEPGHWFWALKAITCADPVPAEAQGRTKLMQKAWLNWLQNNVASWA